MLMLRFSELITGPITGINESESNTTFELNKIVGYNNYAIYPDSYSITTKFFQKKM